MHKPSQNNTALNNCSSNSEEFCASVVTTPLPFAPPIDCNRRSATCNSGFTYHGKSELFLEYFRVQLHGETGTWGVRLCVLPLSPASHRCTSARVMSCMLKSHMMIEALESSVSFRTRASCVNRITAFHSHCPRLVMADLQHTKHHRFAEPLFDK